MPTQPQPDAFRVTLPYSEVCMHMRVAGKTMWVRILTDRVPCAQLLTDDGTPFSSPITTGEAGLHTLPRTPPETITPRTELEVRTYHRARQRCRDCDRRLLPNAPLNDGTQDEFGRCEDCADDIAREVAAAESAAGWDPNP